MPLHDNSAVVEISQTANKFRSSIVLAYDNKYIDVKSILGLFTTLIFSGGYQLHVHGPDAVEAKAAMMDIFKKHKMNVEIVEE